MGANGAKDPLLIYTKVGDPLLQKYEI